jgi:hypothetical protein
MRSSTAALVNPVGSNLRQNKKYQAYSRSEESEQHEIIKEKLTGLNWVLADRALEAAHNAKESDYGKLVQLCTALGISYDKAFGKREISVRPLSFPDPLIQMVRKGLCLSNDLPTAKQPEPMAPTPEHAISESPNIRAPDPVVPFDKVAWERRNYAASDKQARLDKATALRHQRKQERQALIARTVQQIQADVPWQNTIPLSKGVL